jgi:Flp pilus assembly protein CpaB
MGALSVVAAIAAVWMARSYLDNPRSRSRSGGVGIESVIVARVDIPFATRIGSEHIRRLLLPTDATAVPNFSKEEGVLGLIASQRVYPGEILARPRFVDRESGSILAALVPAAIKIIRVFAALSH